MADSGRLDELKRKFDENPRRYFAPLANEYRKAGDTDRAIELCRTYLPQQPSHMSGYIVYGQSLFDAGRGDEAAAVFKQALTLDPENIIALRYLGDVARADGDNAGAMQWYGKVLELDPRNEDMANQITALASPSTRKTPRNERVAPPTVRPEPEYDASAVALAQLVSEPDKPQPEIARTSVPQEEPNRAAGQQEERQEEERTNQHGSDRDTQRTPMLVLEESFEIISWPTQMAGSESAAPRPPKLAEQEHSFAATEPDMDQSSELVADDCGEEEHDTSLEQEARSFADFLPDEPAPLTPAADGFFDITSVLHRSSLKQSGDQAEGEDEEADGSPPESPFVTETMAELYVQQGLADDALVIYRQLVLRRPDARLHQRIAELEGNGRAGNEATSAAEPEPSTPPSAVPPVPSAEAHAPSASRSESSETVRDFFARIGAVTAQSHPHIAAENEGGLSAIFGSAADDAADLNAAQSLAGAFGSAPPAAVTPRD
ncbi:MAG: tetratricopeptide repeat protein [Gemmatimonadaceae bacterium]